MRTLSDLTAKWASVAEFARDASIKPSHAHTMLVRGNIPVDYWPGIISAADRRGIEGVDADLLMKLHAGAEEAAAQ